MNIQLIPDPFPYNEAFAVSQMRAKRDELLEASDWTQVADAPVDKQAWATYRQVLRDFPSTWTPGPTAEFPDPPNA